MALLHVALKDTGPSILGRQHPSCLITRMQLAGRTVCVLGALAAPMASTPMVVAGALSGCQARALRNELSCLHEEGKDTQGPPTCFTTGFRQLRVDGDEGRYKRKTFLRSLCFSEKVTRHLSW